MWHARQDVLSYSGPNPALTGAGAVTNVASNWASPSKCSASRAAERFGAGALNEPLVASNTVMSPPERAAASSPTGGGAVPSSQAVNRTARTHSPRPE